MRVCHVISSIHPRAGGTAATAVGLAKAQARCGADVRLVTTWRLVVPETLRNELAEAGVRLELIGPALTGFALHLDTPRVLRRHIRDADIVHIHTLWEEPQHHAARICRQLGVPYIMMPQGMLDPWSLSQRRLFKKAYMALRLRRQTGGPA